MLITRTPAVTALADALTVPDGGFTVSLSDGRRPRMGYAVSIFPDRQVKIHGTASPADLIAYTDDHADLLGQRGALFGGWRDRDTGTVYLDVSVWQPHRQTAERLARQHGQLAYFDLLAGRSVMVAPALI
jgi:hypothetical protein